MFGSGDVLRAPFESEVGERPLLAVWLALALAVALPVVPVFVGATLLIAGYVPAALAATERENRLPAVFTDLRSLGTRSIGGALLGLLFLGPPVAASLVTVYGVLFGTASPDDLPALRFLAGSTAVLLGSLFAFYLVPIAWTAYGRTGSLRRAISLSEFAAVGGHGAYFVGWTIGWVTLTVALALGVFLFEVPAVGPFLGSLVVAYGLLLTVVCWGRAVGRTR